MSGRLANVNKLTDAQLYEELTNHGFAAGPVVASTRRLYERKLSQILEGRHGRGDEQQLLQQDDEMEEQLTQPVIRDAVFGHTQRSPDSKSGSVRSRTNLTQTYTAYSGDVTAGRSSYYTPSREQERDEMRAHSSVSSSYPGTVRGIGNYDDNIKASPSWLSNPSVTQQYTSPTWQTHRSLGDEAFGISRYRTALLDTSPGARQDATSRYRSTGLSDGRASLWNRRNPVWQRNKSFGPKAQFGLFVFLLVVAIAFCYVVYNAWYENDPYHQIEQEAIKITEEIKSEHKQE